MSAFSFLKSHPLAIRAHFERVLVLTYALPAESLQPFIEPGLLVDSFEGHGFLAVALLPTPGLRPTFAPSLFGEDFQVFCVRQRRLTFADIVSIRSSACRRGRLVPNSRAAFCTVVPFSGGPLFLFDG